MSSVTTSGAPKPLFTFGRIWNCFGMLVVFAVLFLGCTIFVPNFATFINMTGLGLAISLSGIVACGMLFCLASGDFGLSAASVIACVGVTTAVVINLSCSGRAVVEGYRRAGQRLYYREAENQCADDHARDHADCARPCLYYF